MSRLKWDQTGEKLYETGIEQCVLYLINKKTGAYENGVAWNGVTSIEDSPSGGEPTAIYADNKKYLNLMSAEEFAATINAYTYPDEFAECDGSKEIAPGVYAGQQNRCEFGLCYKTLIGNDTDGTDHGYKLHFIYGALAAPSSNTHNTVNDSPEASEFSWSVSTTPVDVPGAKPSATITFNSTKCDKEKLKKLEDIIYGTDGATDSGTTPRMPLPAELITLLGEAV